LRLFPLIEFAVIIFAFTVPVIVVLMVEIITLLSANKRSVLASSVNVCVISKSYGMGLSVEIDNENSLKSISELNSP
jgi:hypothetical protein